MAMSTRSKGHWTSLRKVGLTLRFRGVERCSRCVSEQKAGQRITDRTHREWARSSCAKQTAKQTYWVELL